MLDNDAQSDADLSMHENSAENIVDLSIHNNAVENDEDLSIHENEQDSLVFETEVEKMKVHLTKEFLEIRSKHTIPLEAIDSMIHLFSEATIKSSEIESKIMKQNIGDMKNHCDSCVVVAQQSNDNDPLHQILVRGLIGSHKRRHTIIKNNLTLLEPYDDFIGQGKKKRQYFAVYFKPRDILTRVLSDSTVLKSVMDHKKELLEAGQITPRQQFGDFFSSDLFHYIQTTLSHEERIKCNNIPLCIGLYSDGFDCENPLSKKGRNSVNGFYLFILNLQEHHRSQLSTFQVVQVVDAYAIGRWKMNKCIKKLVEEIAEVVRTGIDCALGSAYPVRQGPLTICLDHQIQ